MANDSYKPNQYDEYRPSDADAPPVFSPSAGESKSQPSIFDRLKRKNILIGVGIIVFIFILYKMIDAFMLNAEHKQNLVPTPAPIQPISMAPTNAPVAVEPSAAAAMNNRITTLEQQSTTYQTGIDKLNSQMADIQTTLTTMGNRLDTMNTALQGLATQVAAQQTQELQKRVASHKVYRHARVRPVYFVRALVPGRAWLLTRDGATITVGLGDTLPGYGVVQVIDPNQGTLTTSTGAIIGYSPSEN